MNICKRCGKKHNRDSQYCSVKCQQTNRGKTGEYRLCKICDSRFYIHASNTKRHSGEYCSYTCAGIGRRGRSNPNFKEKVKRVCEYCGNEFFVHPVRVRQGKAKFCSRECAIEGRDHRATLESTCCNCGEEFTITRQRMENGKNHFCSKRCYHLYRVKNRKTLTESERTVIITCIVCGKEFHASKYAVQKGMGKYCCRDCFAKDKAKKHNFSHAHGGKREDLDGLYVRSGWEANYARYLKWLVEIGNIQSWEFEPDTFEFPVKRGSKFYTPDFKIINNDGSIEYHEVKGWMDKKSATKIKRMGIHHSNVKLVVIDSVSYKALARDIKNLIPNWEK